MKDSFVVLLFLAAFAFLLEAAETAETELWPNGIVPVKFSPSFTKNETSLIREALNEIQNKTCIRFRYKKAENVDFVVFAKPNFDSTICRSNSVGRKGGDQTVFLGAACIKPWNILHELLHVLGFRHEHNRPDRDEYVTINWDNVLPQFKHHFEKRVNNAIDKKLVGEEYAYDSIMHYKGYEEAKDKNIATIVPKRSVQMGGGDGLSEVDVRRINLLYNCPKIVV